MGWKAITKDGQLLQEDGNTGRPVDLGNEGGLIVVAQEDYGHSVAIDLINGVVAYGYKSLGVQNGTIELDSPTFMFHICDETNVVGGLFHLEQRFEPHPDTDGNPSYVRTDYTTPLQWRPIWFTRHTSTSLGEVTVKVIGAQVTLPEEYKGKNVKKLISLFDDGRIGID